MRTINAILFCLLAGSVFGWPPPQFAKGTFATGTMYVGASSYAAPASPPAPGDGYEANLYAYFKLDSASSSSGMVDATPNGRDWPNRGDTVSSVAGKLGNCFNINIYHGGGINGADFRSNISGTPDFGFGGHSFTIRFWMKTAITAGNNNAFLTSAGEPWSIYIGNPSDGTDTVIDFDLTPNVGPNAHVLTVQNVGDGAWHRIVCWYNNSTFDFGIQFDNNTPVTSNLGGVAFNAGNAFAELSDLFQTDPEYVDELAFWKDVVLSADDRLFDWNGGAGQTYPLP